jgi:hypothetical protein
MSQAAAQQSARGSEAVKSPNRRQRAGVQPDLGVRQVVVVEQHHVRLALADQRGDVRAGALDVGLDPFPADQLAVLEVVQADRDPVGAQGRVVGGRLLLHRERRERAVRADLERGPQGVDIRRLQPLLGPAG